MTAKKTYLISSLSLFIVVLFTFISKYTLNAVFTNTVFSADDYVWIRQIIIMYVISIPAGLGMLCFLPRAVPEKRSLRFSEFIRFTLACYPLLVVGSLLGRLLSMIFTLGKGLFDPMTDLMLSNKSPLMYIVAIIIAPVFEELLFRKFLIDRTVKYGEKTAILFSALSFGLFHANLSQIFFAAAAGLVFAYVYVRTGKIRYTIFMHMIINAISSVTTAIISNTVDIKALMSSLWSGNLPELSSLLVPMLVVFAVSAVTNGLTAAGIVMLVKTIRRLKFNQAEFEIQKGEIINTVYLNVGFIAFAAYCLIKTVLNLMG